MNNNTRSGAPFLAECAGSKQGRNVRQFHVTSDDARLGYFEAVSFAFILFILPSAPGHVHRRALLRSALHFISASSESFDSDHTTYFVTSLSSKVMILSRARVAMCLIVLVTSLLYGSSGLSLATKSRKHRAQFTGTLNYQDFDPGLIHLSGPVSYTHLTLPTNPRV